MLTAMSVAGNVFDSDISEDDDDAAAIGAKCAGGSRIGVGVGAGAGAGATFGARGKGDNPLQSTHEMRTNNSGQFDNSVQLAPGNNMVVDTLPDNDDDDNDDDENEDEVEDSRSVCDSISSSGESVFSIGTMARALGSRSISGHNIYSVPSPTNANNRTAAPVSVSVRAAHESDKNMGSKEGAGRAKSGTGAQAGLGVGSALSFAAAAAAYKAIPRR